MEAALHSVQPIGLHSCAKTLMSLQPQPQHMPVETKAIHVASGHQASAEAD